MDFDPDTAMVEAAMNVPAPIDPSLFNRPLTEFTPAPAVEDEEATEEQAPEEDDFAPQEFDPKARDAFIGMLYVGHLSTTFVRYGHSFSISTPSQYDRLQIGLLIREYVGTPALELAYSTAYVAAFLRKVDHHDLPQPIGPHDTGLQDRYKWVVDNLKRQVVNELYEECLVLDQEVDLALAAMGKA